MAHSFERRLKLLYIQNMSILIRPAVQSDIPYLYAICLQTGDSGKDATHVYSDPLLIGQYYAAPYLFHDISLCFIAQEDRIPKGYIIATANTNTFNTWFEENWLPELRLRYPREEADTKTRLQEKQLIIRLHEKVEPYDPDEHPWICEYPAHLHIDLLPEIQGKGCGRALMDTLLSALEHRHCAGLHLGVSATNTNAIAFYQKLGFCTLEEENWGRIMGRKIGGS